MKIPTIQIPKIFPLDYLQTQPYTKSVIKVDIAFPKNRVRTWTERKNSTSISRTRRSDPTQINSHVKFYSAFVHFFDKFAANLNVGGTQRSIHCTTGGSRAEKTSYNWNSKTTLLKQSIDTKPSTSLASLCVRKPNWSGLIGHSFHEVQSEAYTQFNHPGSAWTNV